MTIMTGSGLWTATLDHRTGATVAGGPASRYHRVARCDDRRRGHVGWHPNYAARRLGALFVVLSVVMAGTWLIGEVAGGLAGQPASAAAASSIEATLGRYVARSGDTLWSIADAHRGDVSRERYVDALVALNDGTTIYVGQSVHLP